MNVIYYDIPEKVKLRKNEVDILSLQKTLKKHKKMTIKKIADSLNVPKTEVDHWFRTDKFFAIPNENIWFDLKKLLNIETDEFDNSITEFIERDGVHDQTNRVYDVNGIAPTLTSNGADIRIIL